MSSSRHASARDARGLYRLGRSRETLLAGAILLLLSAWSVGYELGDSVVPAVGKALAFQGIAPDIAFGLAAALLIRRGLTGERGWLLIGIGALCWAAGDTYWSLALANMSSPPVPSWADAGYL